VDATIPKVPRSSGRVEKLIRQTLVCRAVPSRLNPLALDPKLLAIGLGGGLLSGLLGVGGGIVMVPLLVLWAAYSQRDAHALSLGAIIPISIAGIATYGAAGKVHWWTALGLAAGAVFGARLGARWLAGIDERRLKIVFGLFLVGVAVLVGVRA
jgi:uncharacterized protein